MEIGNQFDTQGYIVIKKLFSQSEIKEITSIVDYIYQQWLPKNYEALIEERLINMHSLTDSIYFRDNDSKRIKFFELIAPKKLTKLIENIFGNEIYFHNTQLFFNPYSKEKLPYWHRDLQYSPIEDEIQEKEQSNILTLHIRIPLVAEKGIELIPGTHKRWDSQLEKKVRFALDGHKNSEELPGAILIELEPRDVLIFNAQMIHKGNYKLNKVRKALDICVGKKHSFTSDFLDINVLPTNEEIKYISNNHWYKLARNIAASNNVLESFPNYITTNH